MPVQFLAQCDNVAIMNEGEMVYFGPWNENAQRLLNQYLPVSHLLAAGGVAEQPQADSTKKVAPKPKASSHQPSFKEKVPKVQPCAMAKKGFSTVVFLHELYALVICAMHCGAVLQEGAKVTPHASFTGVFTLKLLIVGFSALLPRWQCSWGFQLASMMGGVALLLVRVQVTLSPVKDHWMFG
jgi:hypothetical protein